MAEQEFMMHFVKPPWLLSRKTRSPLCEVGVDAIVAGCDCANPNRGMDSSTKDPGVQLLMCGFRMQIFVTPSLSIAENVARLGKKLLVAQRNDRIILSTRNSAIGM